jgi:hypothetical protein
LNVLNKPGFEHIPLYNKWVFYEDSGSDLVDLAILPVEPVSGISQDTVMGSLSSLLIYGREGMRQLFDRDLKVGDDIMFFGLFDQYTGHRKNYPIVRFGKVSLITDEGLPGVEPWLGVSDYFLVECQAYPGMSGSPVFAMKEHQGIERYFLIGIIAGYYKEDAMVEGRFSHFGISQVIPVEKLGNILWGDRLQADRAGKLGNPGVTAYPSREG